MKSRIFSIIALVISMIAITGMGVAAAAIDVVVPANPLWTDTGTPITSGQTVHIEATGQWTTGSTGLVGPDGEDVGASWDLFLTSSAPSHHGQLIAFIGQSPYEDQNGANCWGEGSYFPRSVGEGYWAIGSSATFTADRSGELWLGINDDAVSKSTNDNGGVLATVTTVSSVPEFPTIAVPMVAILGLTFMFRRRK